MKKQQNKYARAFALRTTLSSTLLWVSALLLTAASFLAPSTATAADQTYLMPTGPGGGQTDNHIQPFDGNPDASGSLTRNFLTYGVDADNHKVPLKTLRITNNTEQTVYPIMRDPNTATICKTCTVGLYDPYDLTNKEYRGYIGYDEGGKYYFGLRKHESILVSIPLVFWNGGRIGIGTDGQYLTPPSGLPNPLHWDENGYRSITAAQTSGDTIKNGVVMWYRAAKPVDFAPDAADQLVEPTIRDHSYLVNKDITRRTNGLIPDSELITLINYDVSNVESLYLPLAMEATDVWVIPQGSGTGKNANRDGWRAGSDPDVYGWTGGINTIDFLQGKLRDFTADNNQLLKQYFGGKGWPFYNIPNPTNDPDAPIKIPSGANIFAQSPLKATPSSYGDDQWQNGKYMLSSGGTAPIKVNIGNSSIVNLAGKVTLNLNNLEPQAKMNFIKPGYIVTGFPGRDKTGPNPIQVGTTVKSADYKQWTVLLDKPLANSSDKTTYTFTRPVDDYASDAMIRLWYSWALYYYTHWKDNTKSAPTDQTPIAGCSIKKNRATLSFPIAHPELVKGMAVTGPGLDDAMTEVDKHQGDALILEIASDKKSVILSQVANKDSTNATFTFRRPQPLKWAPIAKGIPGYPMFGLQFSKEPASKEPAWHDPYEFSQQVYLIMASINQIGKTNNYSVSKFMQDIIGANMGYIFAKEATDPNVADGQMVIAMIRDMIKSVLRGVTDFTKYPDVIDDHGNHTRWYPNPAEPHGKQPFNVFNLDPFVWFVHVPPPSGLGFSGYGFSLDDDTADVGAGGPSQLQVTVTGTKGLTNTHQWSVQAPYGPVKNVSLLYSGRASTNGDTLYQNLQSVSGKNISPIKITAGGHNLANGDKVHIDQVYGNTAADGDFKVANATRNTFDLVKPDGTPTIGNGDYVSTPTPGRWSYPLHPYIDSGADLTKVFYRVTGDDALGTFQGTFVSVNGVDSNKSTGKKFRVWQKGKPDKGRLLLDADLTDASGVPLPGGTYNFTFFGVAETSPALGSAPPPNLGAIRQEIRQEIHQDRKELKELRRIDAPHEASIRQWLHVRLQVLRARLAYPTDDVLEQIDENMTDDGDTFLSNGEKRSTLKELHARLAELQAGG
jgi:hypothetical protein